jgi:thiol-disulfide isomerase/thioredoxin
MLTTALLASILAADVLVPGKPAPAFTPEKFIKGTEVKALEPGKVHVIEFWATWCPPCVASMPHLTQLQKDNPDIAIIGVACFERGGDAAAKEKRVQDFVDARGDGVGFAIAYDADGSMGRDWMTAAKRNGIPCSFVVGKDGKIAFIGSPNQELDRAIEAAKSKPAPAREQAGGGAPGVEVTVKEEPTDETGTSTSTSTETSSSTRTENGRSVTETVTVETTVEVKDGVRKTTTRRTTSRNQGQAGAKANGTASGRSSSGSSSSGGSSSGSSSGSSGGSR